MSAQNPKRQSINTPATQVLYDNLHFSQATRVGDTIWAVAGCGG